MQTDRDSKRKQSGCFRRKKTLLAAASLLLLPVWPADSARGEILWRDDFETGAITGWTEVVGAEIVGAAEKVHAGGYAVEFQYQPGSQTNGWLWKKGLNPEGFRTVYVRWFQKWETGWTWTPDDLDQKIMLVYGLDPPDEWGSTADWRLYLHTFGEEGVIQMLNFRTPDGWSVMRQNQGEPHAFRTNQWECIEVMIRVNTVGVADGAVHLWINDELRAAYDNIEMRNTDVPLNAIMVNNWHTSGSDHLQCMWVDDIVVSTERIGGAEIPLGQETDTGVSEDVFLGYE